MFRTTIIIVLFALSNCEQLNYDEDIANRMVNISAATYYVTSLQADANICRHCYPGFKVAKVIYQLEQLVIIGYEPTLKSVVVAFRGSKEPTNFLQDAFAVPTPYALCLFCFVHAGFAHALNLLYLHNLKQEILWQMEKHPGCGIIFTGHSLGGALGSLAASNFQEQFGKKYSNIEIYTFGQPRVGGKLFASYQDKQLPSNFRIVHESDPMPHLPIKKMLYRHSGVQIWYEKDMKSIKGRCRSDSDDCSNSANHLPVTVKLFDHDYRKYALLSNKLGLKDLDIEEL